jgi:hypothetical protein
VRSVGGSDTLSFTSRQNVPLGVPAVLIFDSHLDLALNAVDWNRDIRMSIAEIRAQESMLGV